MKVAVSAERDEVVITMSLNQGQELEQMCSDYSVLGGRYSMRRTLMAQELGRDVRRAMRETMFPGFFSPKERVMKVAINDCHGGFSISFAAATLLAERGNAEAKEYVTDTLADMADGGTPCSTDMRLYDTPRHDPALIAVIEELGVKESSGAHARLAIVEIPDGVEYVIDEYDGAEWVAEKHRTWHAE